jgi:hypothetical protein
MVAVATTLASFPKLLVVVMWVWDYRDAYLSQVLAILCISSLAEALRGTCARAASHYHRRCAQFMVRQAI